MLPKKILKMTSLLLTLVLIMGFGFTGSALAVGLEVTSTNPVNQATGVPVNIPEIMATFNEDISAGDNFDKVAVYETSNKNNTVAITSQIRGDNLLVLTPQTALQAEKNYTVEIVAGAVKTGPEFMIIINQLYKFTFTTAADTPDKVVISAPASFSMTFGDAPTALGVTTNPADADIAYSGYDANIISVDNSTGQVTAVNTGSTTITVNATKNGYLPADPVDIPVTVNKGTLTINGLPTVVNLVYGGTPDETALSPTSDPSGAVFGYVSSNPSAATVSGAGVIEAAGEGEAIITVTATKDNYNTATASVTVTVTKEDTPPGPTIGDLNGDGEVDVADVQIAINIALEKGSFSDAQKAAADINGDGVVNVLDVVKIINIWKGITV